MPHTNSGHMSAPDDCSLDSLYLCASAVINCGLINCHMPVTNWHKQPSQLIIAPMQCARACAPTLTGARTAKSEHQRRHTSLPFRLILLIDKNGYFTQTQLWIMPMAFGSAVLVLVGGFSCKIFYFCPLANIDFCNFLITRGRTPPTPTKKKNV